MTAARSPRTDDQLTPGARRILEVASELFYQRGIHAVGVDTIAAESGVTKRTLYDRFGSKDNLVTAYLRARHRAWWQRLEERLAAAPGSRTLAVFDAYAEDLLPADRGCGFLNAAAELPREHPGYRVVQVHKRAVRRRLEELLREERPELQAEITAEHLFLLLEGAIAHRGIDGDGHLARRARSIATQLLDAALGPSREHPPAGG
jgi:AcrR family transcriptional regulator